MSRTHIAKLIYIKLFATTGRLIKEIPREDLPKALPEFINYAGNLFSRGFAHNDYSEVGGGRVYLYEEKRVLASPNEGGMNVVEQTEESAPQPD
jgi:hypothetical protein